MDNVLSIVSFVEFESNERILYECLCSSEKARYIAKLEAVGLTLEDDPNSKESGRISRQI